MKRFAAVLLSLVLMLSALPAQAEKRDSFPEIFEVSYKTKERKEDNNRYFISKEYLITTNEQVNEELAAVADALYSGADLWADERTAKHADWASGFPSLYFMPTRESAWDVVCYETGLVFAKVLEHAGVFKRTEEGQEAFLRFLTSV